MTTTHLSSINTTATIFRATIYNARVTPIGLQYLIHIGTIQVQVQEQGQGFAITTT